VGWYHTASRLQDLPVCGHDNLPPMAPLSRISALHVHYVVDPSAGRLRGFFLMSQGNAWSRVGGYHFRRPAAIGCGLARGRVNET